jgi:hypothetical protein
MTDEGYRKVVGEQAVEFERRLCEAKVDIKLSVSGDGQWVVDLRVPTKARVYMIKDPMLATALWRAANAAGLTVGLDPPPNIRQRFQMPASVREVLEHGEWATTPIAAGQRWVWDHGDPDQDVIVSSCGDHWVTTYKVGVPGVQSMWKPEAFREAHPCLRHDPYAWAKPGVWSVHVDGIDVGSPAKLLRSSSDGIGLWDTITPCGKTFPRRIVTRRPATPEEAERFEAELAAATAEPPT